MIKLPKKFADVENEVNNEIERLEGLVKSLSSLPRITSANTKPQQVEEDKVFLHVDGTTRELMIRNQGQTFVVTLTKR